MKFSNSPFWIESAETPDTHVLFRGHFHLDEESIITIRHTGASMYRLWVDESVVDEGPARFDQAFPEYLSLHVKLAAGNHVLAAHVHNQGETTRLLNKLIRPFLWVALETSSGHNLDLSWKGFLANAYFKTKRRLGCVLGPVEWCDTQKMPQDWKSPHFPDSEWREVSPTSTTLEITAAHLGTITTLPRPVTEVQRGELVNMSPVTHDPAMNFVTRDLTPTDLPADGIWHRYDLHRIQLGRPRLRVKAPAGTWIQCAYAECLTHSRVSPYLKSGGGDNSCMMDTWISAGGWQELEPLQPKGARFIEVHLIGAQPSELALESFEWTERTYYPNEPEGSFSCSDKLLERIWKVGVNTLQSCAEDAITDNPHRERGQWLGDAVGAGMDILAVSYQDWRPLERGLLQAAQCADEDGQIPAVFPGTREYLPSFAIQWVSAIPHYYRLGGSIRILRELYQPAVQNLESFATDRVPLGLSTNPKHWNFIDWGYRGSATVFLSEKTDAADFDPALSLIYLKAIRSMTAWAAWLNEDTEKWTHIASDIAQNFRNHLKKKSSNNPDYWKILGYHSTALALEQQLIPDTETDAAVSFIKHHILQCFPNTSDAPRLSGTTVEEERVITPFFFHHTLPILIEHGEMDFVLEQMRTCWGWALNLGLTTWPEVFDPRWSHCHQWSGCPTWILSRYVLGLHARFDLGENFFELKLHPGDLSSASGHLPLRTPGEQIEINWKRIGAEKISYSLRAPRQIHLLSPCGWTIDTDGEWQGELSTTPRGAASLIPENIAAPANA